MRVTIANWDARPAHYESQARDLAEHGSNSGSTLVLLPEMPFTPWLPLNPQPDQAKWLRSVAGHEDRIADLACRTGVAIAGSRPVVRKGRNHNQAFLWAARGFVPGMHEKCAVPDEEGYWEARWYLPGNARRTPVGFGDVAIGFAICNAPVTTRRRQRPN